MPEIDTTIISPRVEILAETDSTNRLALEATTDGQVFVADQQTGGRGRHGASWHSAPGVGLWFSVSLKGSPEGLTFAAALALRDALVRQVPVRVKWPNDLMAGDRKLAGILVEHRAGQSALGIGLNVHHVLADFPEELQKTAGSLQILRPGGWHRGEVLAMILNELDRRLVQLREGGPSALHSDWVVACDILGRSVRRGGIHGTVRDIAPDGALLVETPGGLVRVTDEVRVD